MRADTPTGYEPLADILDAALMQAATGKGSERHANGLPFTAQPMQRITGMVGIGFPLGQAMKKAQEAGGMASRGQADAARRELLGAINYLAGAVLALNDEGTKAHGWHHNDYTDLHRQFIGPIDAHDGTGLFPSGWTPESDTGDRQPTPGVYEPRRIVIDCDDAPVTVERNDPMPRSATERPATAPIRPGQVCLAETITTAASGEKARG